MRIVRPVFIVMMVTWLLITAVACDDTTITEDFPTPVSNTNNNDNTPVENLPPSTDDSWYEIYFTNPLCPDEEERTGGLDDLIAADLHNAQTQVDIAAFDLDAQPIVDALIDVAQAGVPVRVVTDTDNAELDSIAQLRSNSITVIEDDRSALMHNKFIVIDGRYLYTGSLNYTTNGVYCNNNNLVRINSPVLANNYLTEMAEMYDEGSFGPRSPENTPQEKLTIDGIQVENYFAPETELAPIITELINQAESDIKFMAFSFTHEDIGEAMIAQAEAGVNVMGVFETTGSNTEFSYYPDMLDMELPNLQVRQDGNSRVMHHKVIIIDGTTTLLGSFNFTGNANDSNDENVLIVHDPEFTSFFLEEFDAVWNEAKP